MLAFATPQAVTTISLVDLQDALTPLAPIILLLAIMLMWPQTA